MGLVLVNIWVTFIAVDFVFFTSFATFVASVVASAFVAIVPAFVAIIVAVVCFAFFPFFDTAFVEINVAIVAIDVIFVTADMVTAFDHYAFNIATCQPCPRVRLAYGTAIYAPRPCKLEPQEPHHVLPQQRIVVR
jgi:hypothetical protein